MKFKQKFGSSPQNPIEIFPPVGATQNSPTTIFPSNSLQPSSSISFPYNFKKSPELSEEILIASSQSSESEKKDDLSLKKAFLNEDLPKKPHKFSKNKKLKRKLADIEETNDEKWPLFLGSFVIKTTCPLLSREQIKQMVATKAEIEVTACSIEDSIVKKPNGSYQHRIFNHTLKTFMKVDGLLIDEISHFCSEVWSFLLNFDIITLKAVVLEEKIEKFHTFVLFKFSVYLKKTVTLKEFNLNELLSNAIPFYKADDEGQHYRKQELLKYCKESLIILLDMLKVRKTQNAMIDLKKKISLYKKFAHNYQTYPDIFIKKCHANYYITNVPITDFNFVLFKNNITRLFDQDEEPPTTTEVFNNFSIFEDEQTIKVNPLEEEKNKEFLHFMNSNDFIPQLTPTTMNISLHEYQKQALSWFLYREEAITETQLFKCNKGNEKKINPLYEEYRLIDGTYLYFNIFTGHACVDFPEISFLKGGILADEMGLGKTIMALSLIHANKPETKPKLSRLKSLSSQKKVKGEEKEIAQTLIVMPLSILDQWKKEIIMHSTENSIKVGQFYGNSRKSFKMDEYHVILMTYDGLVQEFKNFKKSKKSIIFQKEWFRVILDEAHCIKNRKSVRNEACCTLKSINRWVLTGTPIHNNLDDLYSLIKFLKVRIFGEEYCWWNQYINNSADFMQILKHIVGPILLRRTKDSVDEKGDMILKLPGKAKNLIKVEMTPEERKIYENLFQKSRDEFLVFLRNGSALKNYTGIFAMIMRLRQCCDHPSLVFRPIQNGELEKELKNFLLKTGTQNKSEKFSCDSDFSDEEIDHIMTCFQKKSVNELIEMIKQNKFTNCPICLSDMIEASLTKCCHIACYECLKKAIKMNGYCPICRTKLNSSEICKICRFLIIFFLFT